MNKPFCATPATAKPFTIPDKVGSSKRTRGFSLVEILISIIVLSFGLLGMVGLQAAALQANRDARIQSSAVRLARELGELMRSNKEVGIATTTANNPYLIDYANPASNPVAVTSAPTNCFTGDCYTAQTSAAKIAIAKFEVRDWLTRLNADLPGARVKVCFDSTPFDASGLPQWDCSNSGGVAVIKIGWTKASTNRSNTGADAFEKATKPSVVLPVTAGSST